MLSEDKSEGHSESHLFVWIPRDYWDILELNRKDLLIFFLNYHPKKTQIVVFNITNLFKKATSDLKEFELGTRFRDIIPETHPNDILEPSKIKKVVICAG